MIYDKYNCYLYHRNLVGLVLFLFVLGLPVVLGSLLYRARHKIRTSDEYTQWLFDFVVGDYRTNYFWSNYYFYYYSIHDHYTSRFVIGMKSWTYFESSYCVACLGMTGF